MSNRLKTLLTYLFFLGLAAILGLVIIRLVIVARDDPPAQQVSTTTVAPETTPTTNTTSTETSLNLPLYPDDPKCVLDPGQTLSVVEVLNYYVVCQEGWSHNGLHVWYRTDLTMVDSQQRAVLFYMMPRECDITLVYEDINATLQNNGLVDETTDVYGAMEGIGNRNGQEVPVDGYVIISVRVGELPEFALQVDEIITALIQEGRCSKGPAA